MSQIQEVPKKGQIKEMERTQKRFENYRLADMRMSEERRRLYKASVLWSQISVIVVLGYLLGRGK